MFRPAARVVLVLAALLFFPPFSSIFSSFIFSFPSVVRPLLIFRICSDGRSLTMAFVNCSRKRTYCAFLALAVMRGTRVSRSRENWSFVTGLKRASLLRSMVSPGFEGSPATTALTVLLDLETPISPKRSSACLRSESCSVFSRRARRAASSSSSSSLLLSSSNRRAFSACLAAILSDFDFLAAAASVSALALRAAAFLAFSASSSVSVAASQSSTTYIESSVS
jgi:hypothetical protein